MGTTYLAIVNDVDLAELPGNNKLAGVDYWGPALAYELAGGGWWRVELLGRVDGLETLDSRREAVLPHQPQDRSEQLADTARMLYEQRRAELLAQVTSRVVDAAVEAYKAAMPPNAMTRGDLHPQRPEMEAALRAAVALLDP